MASHAPGYYSRSLGFSGGADPLSEQAQLAADLKKAKLELQKVTRKQQETASAQERQQAQLDLMLEAREANTEKEAALRKRDALERQLHQTWAKATFQEDAPGEAKDLVAVDGIGAGSVESLLRAESAAMRTAIRYYERQQQDTETLLAAHREREALHKKYPRAEEAARLDTPEGRIVAGDAFGSDASGVEDSHELMELKEALYQQQASLGASQATRDAWQDEASDLLHLLQAAEARAAQLEQRLTGGTKSKAAEALEALRESGYEGAAALVVVLARLCGGPRLAFLAIDANNSGAVSTYEFDSALRMQLGLDYEAITGLKLRSLFKEFDTRRCGLVYGVDMVSAFSGIWRAYGIPEEIARDPLLNPDLEGPGQDEVLREQQRWLMAAKSSPRRTGQSISPRDRSPRSPNDVMIRDEWQRGYHTVGIPVSSASRAVTLPGVSPRIRRERAPSPSPERAKPTTSAPIPSQHWRESPGSAGSTLESPRLAAKHQHQQRRRLSDEDFKGPVQRVAQPNRSGAMADSQQAAAKQHQKLQTRAKGAEEDPGPRHSRERPPRSATSAGAMDSQQLAAKHRRLERRLSEEDLKGPIPVAQPNRSGAMADSQQAAAKQHQKLQTRAKGAEEDPDPRDSRQRPMSPTSAGAMDSQQLAAKHRRRRLSEEDLKGPIQPVAQPNRSGAMADSQQAAAKQHQKLQTRAKGAEEDPDPRDSRQRPMSPTSVGAMDSQQLAAKHQHLELEVKHDDSRRSPVPADEDQSRRPQFSPEWPRTSSKESASDGNMSRRASHERPLSTHAQGPGHSAKSTTWLGATPEAERMRTGAGGAGPIPSPEIMDKAARARSLLYVAPEAKQRRRQEVRPEKRPERDVLGSVSSTLGVTKPRPETARSEEDLTRRDSSPPSFLCGRSFGRNEEVLLPLRPKERHVRSLENSPSPSSERGLQDLMRGEVPQLLWTRSPEKAARLSQFSFAPDDLEQERSTFSKSTKTASGRSSRPRDRTPSHSPSSRSPRSPILSPRSTGRSVSPYTNRAIYVYDTPWSRPAPVQRNLKAWK